MLPVEDIDKCFPFSQYREGQREAIKFAVDSFNSGKKFVIIEAPTGAGKSGVGMTMLNMVGKSYYLTITKILQDQLLQEFGDKLVELRGRASYPCTFWDRMGQQKVKAQQITEAQLNRHLNSRLNCAEGYCRTDAGQGEKIGEYKCTSCFMKGENGGGKLSSLPDGMIYSACPYYDQLERAIRAPRLVMNFHAFMMQTQMAKRFAEERDLMVIDEGHTAESVLLSSVSLILDDRYLRKVYGLELPVFDTAIEYAIWFGENNVKEMLAKQYRDLKDKSLDPGYDNVTRREITKEMDEVGRTYRRFLSFMDHMTSDDPCDWVVEVDTNRTETYRRIVIKPVMISAFSHQLLFKYAKRVLIMSATVLDAGIMCKSLGINRNDVATYRMKNRFPVENRIIHYQPAAKVTGGKDAMSQWGPKLVSAVNDLAAKHAGQRGIVHTHNFAIADFLLQNCKPSVVSRFTYQKDDRFRDKQDLLEHHESIQDSIIIAPAMHEGINLIDDLSRWQVLCKVPYPNFYEDKQLARRMEIDRRYYDWLTCLKLVQSYGRSIRSETDFAETYVIDASFYNFVKTAKGMLPSWFTEAIDWGPHK